MSAYKTIFDTLDAKLRTVSGVTYVWDAFGGEKFVPENFYNSSWCRPSVVINNARRTGANPTATSRIFGELIIQLFVPENEGDKVISETADTFIATFDKYSSAGVRFMEKGYAKVVGPDLDGPWFQWNVILPFYYEG